MLTRSLRFISLLLTSLLAGAMFCIWLGFNPATLTASAYVEVQQNAIRTLNAPLPALGLVCILQTAILAVRTRDDKRGRYILVGAVLCLTMAGIVTRLGNQPINAEVMTWSRGAPPANWTALRDAWWRWHIVRTVLGCGALVLALLAAIGREPASRRV